MRVHHLNCGTMLVPGQPMVCHVLLVETGDGLVLVDTGIGLADIADPAERLGGIRHLLRPTYDADETAARRVEALGFTRDEVRDVVVTHFDLDHVGGLADFPRARVHTTTTEAHAAVRARSWRGNLRYRPVQWAHGVDLVEHEPTGEPWHGFPAARELDAIAPGIVLIPLPGHSVGHAAVGVDTGSGWVVHAGDAFFHRGTLDGSRIPAVIAAFEALVADDRAAVRANHQRLAEVHADPDSDLTVVCAHDPEQLALAQSASGP